jgi:hypothetical protein
MKSLSLHAGPRARERLASSGLQAADIRAIPAAAGGPKGLILNALDRFLFADWLAGEGPPVHLAGASIGAWRMACACLPDADAALQRLATDYIHERYDPPPGQRQSKANVSRHFSALLARHLGDQADAVLRHPRLRLHVITSRGRGLLQREHPWRTPLGYGGAWLANAAGRPRLGRWLERVVFSDPRDPLPLRLQDFPTTAVALSSANLQPAVIASGSIPFWLEAVHDLPGAPPGAYWDGGITDYHLHWPWADIAAPGLVLYPHFQTQIVPGWLDKAWKRRHRATPALDNLLVLSPRADWIARLPGGKLPDRQDFKALPYDERTRRWTTAVAQSQQLADEFAGWLHRGCPVDEVQPL